MRQLLEALAYHLFCERRFDSDAHRGGRTASLVEEPACGISGDQPQRSPAAEIPRLRSE
jgi:hypothetical protein